MYFTFISGNTDRIRMVTNKNDVYNHSYMKKMLHCSELYHIINILHILLYFTCIFNTGKKTN